jgi:hypothetical protein
VGTLEYRIHPSVGVARMGDSATHFFVGPESAEEPFRPVLRPMDALSTQQPEEAGPGTFRDPEGRIARQAARFRVFGCYWADGAEGGPPSRVWEVRPDDADLVWTVEVANRKGGTSAANEPGARTLDTRETDDGEVTSLEAEGRLPLGAVALEPVGDQAGALLVIGSAGSARDTGESDHVPDWLERNPQLDPDDSALLGSGLDHLVNAGWEDDAGDGRVSVEVVPRDGGHHEGLEPTYRDAWVVIAPPDYAPDAPHLVSLHHVVVDRAERGLNLLRWGDKVDLGVHPPDPDLDVLPLLRAYLDLPWLTPFDPPVTAESAEDLEKAEPTVRRELVSLLRPPLRAGLGPEPIYVDLDDEVRSRLLEWRLLAAEDGEEGRVLPWSRFLVLPRLTHRWLTAWRDDPGGLIMRFAVGDLAPPIDLDRAQMGSMSGGPFRPGIEVGADALRLGRWEGAHGVLDGHVDVRFLGEPGDMTFDLAVPWQVAFQSDEERWWPTSRPVEVVPVGADEPRRWDRDLNGDGRVSVLEHWHALGLLRRGADGSLRETERAGASSGTDQEPLNDLAVTPFAARALAPALGTSELEAAARWTRDRFPVDGDVVPTPSGVGLDELETAIGHYIDLEEVAQHLAAAHGDEHADDRLEVLVEGIHQFQRRVFDRDHAATGCRRQAASSNPFDGHPGVMTLDSLGLVHRDAANLLSPGHRLLQPNATAQGRLDLLSGVPAAERIMEAAGYDPATWFDGLMNPSFLGRTVRWGSGIHVELVRQLRVAERQLLTLDAFEGMSPAELGEALGITEAHAGARPNNTGGSMHLYGLAIDIDYCLNPWIAGAFDAATANQKFIDAFRRASMVVRGEERELTPAVLHALGSGSTEEADRVLRRDHETFVEYLGGEEGADDLAALRRAPTNFPNERDPGNGFYSLHRELVLALRDGADMVWGAIDFGVNQSGDVMHFDVRNDGGVGSLVRAVSSQGRWNAWLAQHDDSGEE